MNVDGAPGLVGLRGINFTLPRRAADVNDLVAQTDVIPVEPLQLANTHSGKRQSRYFCEAKRLEVPGSFDQSA